MVFPTKLEVRLVQATLLANVLEALSDMFSEANLDFSAAGCELQAVDTSGVALVALLVRAEAFNHYRCYRDVSMGLNLADMARVFRCAENDDIITIKAEEDFSNTAITVKFESPEDGMISDFDFDFLAIDGVPLVIPEFEYYQATVRIPSAKFMCICNTLSCFRDRDSNSMNRDTVVVISVDKEHVRFSTRGKNVTAKVYCRHTQTDGKPKVATLIEMKENVSLKFSLRYIKSFSKVPTLSDQVTISLAFEKPAVFEFEIAGMGYIRYYISPLSTLPDQVPMQNERDEMQN